jgi:hypothetical protein
MGKQRIRWALATAVVVLFAAGLSPIPAVAGASPAPPAPSQGPDQSDLGIVALRRQLLQGATSVPNATPRTQAPLTSACSDAWRVVDGQSGGWNNFLGGVAAISPTDMWAVGNSQANLHSSFGNGDQNLAEHWDGSAWTAVPFPQPGSDANDLTDVAAASSTDAWAVGVANSIGSTVAPPSTGTALPGAPTQPRC